MLGEHPSLEETNSEFHPSAAMKAPISSRIIHGAVISGPFEYGFVREPSITYS